MNRRIASARALETEFVNAVCAETGEIAESVARYVKPIVSYLQREYGGGKLYIARAGRTVSIAAIKRDRKDGVPLKIICKKYALSYRTLQRILTE